jgi:glycyl-tRNA synthetase beta subunit
MPDLLLELFSEEIPGQFARSANGARTNKLSKCGRKASDA